MNKFFIAALAGICAGGITAVATTAPARAGDVAPRQLPGYWEVVTTGLTAKPTTTRSCVSREDSAAAFLREQRERGCTFTRDVYAGGRIDLASTCPGGESATMTGSYTPTSATATIRGVVKVGEERLPLNMTMKSRRIAATCPAGEDD